MLPAWRLSQIADAFLLSVRHSAQRTGPSEVLHLEIMCDTVVVLAGVELILFLAVGLVLDFGFMLRSVLVTEQCLSCC